MSIKETWVGLFISTFENGCVISSEVWSSGLDAQSF